MSKKMAKFQVEKLEQRFEMGWMGADHSTTVGGSTTVNPQTGGQTYTGTVSHTIKW